MSLRAPRHGGHRAVCEPAQQPQHRGFSHQMPLPVIAAFRPAGGGGSLAMPWGPEAVWSACTQCSAGRKNNRRTEGRWVHQAASADGGWWGGCRGNSQGVGKLLTLSQCRVCAQEDRCPLAVATAAGWLGALMTHSMP